MSIQNIKSALITGYIGGGFGLPTSYENKRFTPTVGEPWAKVVFVPNQPSVATLCVNGRDGHDGIFKIILHYPLNMGDADVQIIVDLIRVHFKAGASFIYNGQDVRIMSCGRGLGVAGGAWYTIDVNIEWYARTSRGS